MEVNLNGVWSRQERVRAEEATAESWGSRGRKRGKPQRKRSKRWRTEASHDGHPAAAAANRRPRAAEVGRHSRQEVNLM